MKFRKEDLLLILEEDPPEGFEIVEEDAWVQDGKYQYKDTIFSYQGKYYELTESRSGSPFTDWEYDSEYWPDEKEVPEVEKVPTTIYQWKEVK